MPQLAIVLYCIVCCIRAPYNILNRVLSSTKLIRIRIVILGWVQLKLWVLHCFDRGSGQGSESELEFEVRV